MWIQDWDPGVQGVIWNRSDLYHYDKIGATCNLTGYLEHGIFGGERRFDGIRAMIGRPGIRIITRSE
ncbi:hypothetical protein IGI04_030358 [Brassica rapa subsp. trilocularis]|uniref:Uncharacterized protein n=1 Tax=Brassica rapa subsp. trilocularis TaxID=1813537 RepID=A0ABQ7LQG2_BRACM|nr:hypothetical protein IGI04_030358 [Brassica rapa subsp. trilocularis]